MSRLESGGCYDGSDLDCSKSTFSQLVMISNRRKATYQSVQVVNSLSGADF